MEIEDNTQLFVIYGREDLSKSQITKLKKLGFVLTESKEMFYHPMHWKSIGFGIFDDAGECIDCGDFWVFDDAFKALTPEALSWANSLEYFHTVS